LYDEIAAAEKARAPITSNQLLVVGGVFAMAGLLYDLKAFL
jgi:hypothetical protein